MKKDYKIGRNALKAAKDALTNNHDKDEERFKQDKNDYPIVEIDNQVYTEGKLKQMIDTLSKDDKRKVHYEKILKEMQLMVKPDGSKDVTKLDKTPYNEIDELMENHPIYKYDETMNIMTLDYPTVKAKVLASNNGWKRNKGEIFAKYDVMYMDSMIEVMKNKGFTKDQSLEVIKNSGVDDETANEHINMFYKDDVKASIESDRSDEIFEAIEDTIDNQLNDYDTQDDDDLELIAEIMKAVCQRIKEKYIGEIKGNIKAIKYLPLINELESIMLDMREFDGAYDKPGPITELAGKLEKILNDIKENGVKAKVKANDKFSKETIIELLDEAKGIIRRKSKDDDDVDLLQVVDALELLKDAIKEGRLEADLLDEEIPIGEPEPTENLQEQDIFDLADGLTIGDGYMMHKDPETLEIYVIDREGNEVYRNVNAFTNDMALVIEFMRNELNLENEEIPENDIPIEPALEIPEEPIESAATDDSKEDKDKDIGVTVEEEFDEDGNPIGISTMDEETDDEPEIDQNELSKKIDELIDVNKETNEKMDNVVDEVQEEELPEDSEKKMLELKQQIEEKKEKVKSALEYMIKNNHIKVNADEINAKKIAGETIIFAKQRAQEQKIKEMQHTLLATSDRMIDMYISSLDNNNKQKADNIFKSFFKN